MLNPDTYEILLIEYIKQKFSEFNPKQLLMFGLNTDELAQSISTKVINIPINIEYGAKEKPYGIFHVDEKTKQMSITIGGIDSSKYGHDEKYNSYADSVLWHELIHAVNYIMQPWNELEYDSAFPDPNQYYSSDEEQKAYKAQIEFLSRVYNKRKLLNIMQEHSSDKSPERQKWMEYFYDSSCSSCNRNINRRKRVKANKRKIITASKLAAAPASTLKKYISDDKNETYNDLIADSDRYLTDAYYIIATLRETVDGFSVACHVNAGQLGTTSFANYWHYDSKEYSKAKKTFSDVKTTCINIRKNIEFERLPFSLILPMFRHETRKIDTEHMEIPQIPYIIYNLDSVQEKDWRHTIYGDRYPTTQPPILNYEIDHSIEEQSRYITTTPGLGRDKLYKYKYTQASIKTASSESLINQNYLQIGHSDTHALLWKYDNRTKQIVILREQMFGEHVRPHSGDDFDGDRYQIAGRVDLDKNIGSCDFGFIPNKTELQIDVMNKLVNAFPGVKFLVFKDFKDQYAYPNPEPLQNYYERIAGIYSNRRLKYTKTANKNKRQKYQTKSTFFFRQASRSENIDINSFKSEIEEAAIRNPKPFQDWFKNSDRIYIPLQTEQTGYDEEVADVLAEIDCIITDYRAGYCKQGNRVYRIGKAIELARQQKIKEIQQHTEQYYDVEREIEEKNELYNRVLNTFINSAYRISKKTNNYVVISQNPYDIATMSTNKGWVSCMQLGTGAHYKDVFCEISQGGLVAYLIKENDREIKNPLARISIKRFVNKSGQSVAIPESAIYGNSLNGFPETVKQWLTSKQGDIKPGVYDRKGGSWSDSFNEDILVMPTNKDDVIRWYKGETEDAKTSKFIVRNLLQEWIDDQDEDDARTLDNPEFETREEAEQYVNRTSEFEDELRESYGGIWVEKDEAGEWVFPIQRIEEQSKDNRTNMKYEAIRIILDSPRGTYPEELLKQIKSDLFDSSNSNSELQRDFINKYPDLITQEDIENKLSANTLYKYIMELPEGAEKKQHINNLWRESEKWLDNFSVENWAAMDPMLKERLNNINRATTVQDKYFALDALGLRVAILWQEKILNTLELMTFIPEDIIQKLVNFAEKIENLDILKNTKKNGIIQRRGGYILDIMRDLVSLFNRKKSDTPTVQKLYALLLPYYGDNHNFEPSGNQYSPLNVETLGLAIGSLGINGQQFLPWAKQKLAEEEELGQYLQKDENWPTHSINIYKNWVKRNIERYHWIIDNIENKGYPKKNYRLYKFKNKLTKNAQQYTEWLDGVKPCRILYHPDITGPYKLIELSNGNRMEVSVRRIKKNPIQNKSKVDPIKVDPIKDIYCPNCGQMNSHFNKCENCDQEY